MDPAKTTTTVLDDVKIHVKMKLSALWIAVLVCYIYGDFFSLVKPGALEELIGGKVETGQWGLLAGAISMAIPSVMVFLSLVLKPGVNRWTNGILGVLYTILVLLVLTASLNWAFYVFLSIVESVLTALIVWHAWKWPHREAP